VATAQARSTSGSNALVSCFIVEGEGEVYSVPFESLLVSLWPAIVFHVDHANRAA
jgi:hypothetical protein